MPSMPPMDGSQMPQSSMPTGQGAMAGMEHSGKPMSMAGALGPYPIERESSGTAWQPDSSEHGGLMRMSGDWTLMAHGVLNLVYDHQSGPRGDDKAFASGMLMGMASRPLGSGTRQGEASAVGYRGGEAGGAGGTTSMASGSRNAFMQPALAESTPWSSSRRTSP